MRLVNETDPQAYSVHPFWKDVVYDDSCAGPNLQQYRLNQFSVTEGALQTGLTNLWNVLSVAAIAYRVAQFKWSGVGALLRSLVVCGAVGFMSATVVLMHSHFEQDVTFLTGAIIHHAEAESPGLNLEKGTVSQGYLICGAVNRFFYGAVLVSLVGSSPKLRACFDPLVLVGLLNLGIWLAVSTVKHKHPVYHAIATPEMAHAWPYTLESRAYKHAIVHHASGFSFSGDPFLDPLFDAQLRAFGYLHNKLLHLELASPAHYAFAAAFDGLSGLCCAAVLWVTMRVGALLYPAASKGKTA